MLMSGALVVAVSLPIILVITLFIAAVFVDFVLRGGGADLGVGGGDARRYAAAGHHHPVFDSYD